MRKRERARSYREGKMWRMEEEGKTGPISESEREMWKINANFFYFLFWVMINGWDEILFKINDYQEN